MLDIFLLVFVVLSLFLGSNLYATIALVGVGGYLVLKYAIKGLSKAGVFDDNFETRYTPPTKNTYIAYYSLMAVLGLVIAVILI